MSVRADAESLRLIPIFRECDPVALQVMAFAAERQNFLMSEIIFQEGQPARSAYFVMSGEVSMRVRSDEIGVAQPGSMLGETAMISGQPYSISAVANSSVTTARIDQTLLQRVISEYPGFGQAVAQALSRRLDDSLRELENVRALMIRGRKFSDL